MLWQCTAPAAGSMAYLNGHSYVAFIGADASNAVMGNFELHHVPAGTYALILVTPNYDGIVAGVEVVSGQVTDVGLRRVCIVRLSLLPSPPRACSRLAARPCASRPDLD
jgi:hypothetical protein